MHDAAQAAEAPVEFEVGGRVAGGVQITLHAVALKVHHHHVLGLHHVVFHAAGLDNHQALLAVNGGHIAPGEGDQAVLGQEQVGVAHQLFKFREHE